MGIARQIALLLLLTTAVVGVAACSDGDGGGADAGSPSRSSRDGGGTDGRGEAGKVAAADARLEFRLEQVGAKGGAGIPLPQRASCSKSLPATCTGELACPAADDAREGDVELCAWLADRGRAALEPVEADAREVCTMVYGGAEVATVTGTLDGESVSAEFSRQNGCAIARWEAVAPLWTGEVSSAAAGEAPDAGGSRGAIGNPGTSTSSPPTA